MIKFKCQHPITKDQNESILFQKNPPFPHPKSRKLVNIAPIFHKMRQLIIYGEVYFQFFEVRNNNF